MQSLSVQAHEKNGELLPENCALSKENAPVLRKNGALFVAAAAACAEERRPAAEKEKGQREYMMKAS